MKKNLRKITSALTLLLLAALLLSSCVTVDNSGAAHIEVERALNWKNTYQIGEDVSLDGLTVKYFESLAEGAKFETVTLTRSMISGFDTSKEGSFNMTVTYKGKTATVPYTVVQKATPFEIKKSFAISENTVVSVDSAAMKATVRVFDGYFKAAQGQATKTEERALSFIVNNKGETLASFDYDGSRYDVSYEKDSDQYYIYTSKLSEASSSVSSMLAHPIPLDSLQLPETGVVYRSETKDGVYYSIELDDSYNAVITKHTESGEATVTDELSAADAVLTVNGLLKYSQSKDGSIVTATMSDQGEIKIRKETDGSLVYSALCSK